MRKSGIVVVMDSGKGQRVLDEANWKARNSAKKEERLKPRTSLEMKDINQLSFQALMVQRY